MVRVKLESRRVRLERDPLRLCAERNLAKVQDSGATRNRNPAMKKHVAVIVVVIELVSRGLRAAILPVSPRNETAAVKSATDGKLGSL